MMDTVELSEVFDSETRVGGGSIGLSTPSGVGLDGAPHHAHYYGHPMAQSSSSFHHHQHHPNCAGSYRSTFHPSNIADSDGIDMLCLTPEAYKATEAIEFIAEHLRSEDEYIQVGRDEK